jgi:flagellar motor protein MotB
MRRRQASSDHLSTSLTDLMTSLMVIFVLLLVVFMQKRASADKMITDTLLERLKYQLKGGFKDNIKADQRDPFTILVIVPDDLMTFESGKSALKPAGQAFIDREIPNFASIVCSDEFRPHVDSIVVEGHTDQFQFRGRSHEESQADNLKLSQNRSIEVVQSSLQALRSTDQYSCFLEKLSASGRGEQDLEDTPDRSRRVIFKIRVKAKSSDEAERRLRQASVE